jgi:hypothetical protein
MGRGRALFGRRLVGTAAGLLLVLGLALSPAGAATAVAADPLRVAADATYTLDPAAGRVHVVVHYQVTDLKPDTAQFVYFYTAYRFAIQREATSVRASDSSGGLSLETQNRENYIELTVDFRKDIYYRDTAKFTVRYDLVGGAPRSASSIRVGKAFATWGVWAWGDDGRGSVAVILPQGFTSTTDGDELSKTSSGGRETLRATPASPETFFAIVSAENPLAYTQDRLSLEGGVEIVVMAWPEDTRWDGAVGDTMRTAVPELSELIGLPWPVRHDLDVRERYTPALEGYAGIFFTEEQRIDVSEDLDPVVIVHETSHAWFNDNLFVERWIYEGLAQEYAWRVQQAVGRADGGLPKLPNKGDPGFIPLEQWTFPEVIRDQHTDDTERYGYDASFWVMHGIVDAVGVERMRTAFAAADAHTTAYPGAGSPEKVSARNDWKRFVDLVEPIDGTDSTATERSLRDLVLLSSSGGNLDDRATARKAYRELLEAGDGWLPGWYVRKPMGEWAFHGAQTRIVQATAVLDLRAQVESAAAALGLQPDDALRTAYESADTSLDAASTLANDELAALATIAEARAKVETAPDLVSTIGLTGSTPQVPYQAARDAFEHGDIPGARASAAEAAAIVTGAAALGQERLAIGIGVAVGLLLLLITLLVLRRRRRRRPPALSVATPAAATTTLAADPDAEPPSTSERPSESEGGADQGDPPPDSESP